MFKLTLVKKNSGLLEIPVRISARKFFVIESLSTATSIVWIILWKDGKDGKECSFDMSYLVSLPQKTTNASKFFDLRIADDLWACH